MEKNKTNISDFPALILAITTNISTDEAEKKINKYISMVQKEQLRLFGKCSKFIK